MLLALKEALRDRLMQIEYMNINWVSAIQTNNFKDRFCLGFPFKNSETYYKIRNFCRLLKSFFLRKDIGVWFFEEIFSYFSKGFHLKLGKNQTPATVIAYVSLFF